MPRRYNNFSFVVDSSFRPFEMQELLTPLMMYKDVYEKQEAAYEDLADKSDKFKYLSETLPEGSQARRLYESYANDLNKQAQDLAKNGLSVGNRRALMNLKKRYKSEIGRLVDADTALQEERKLRRTTNAKDSSMLYANDNLSIDQFLDGNTPNLYSVSSDDLRKEAAQYAQTASSRINDNTQINDITDYYQEIIQTQGYSPETMRAFRKNLETVPEFNQAVQDIMDARGVSTNLTGDNYERARQSIINGIMEGALYKKNRDIKDNPGVMTAAQKASNALGWANHNENVKQRKLQMAMRGFDENGVYHKENDQELLKEREKAIAQGKLDNNGNPVKKPEKPTRRNLKEARAYTKDGTVSPIRKAEGTTYGKPIDYNRALEIAPAVAQHDPGYETKYEYFENANGAVSVVPKDSYVLSSDEVERGTIEEDNDQY